MKSLPFILLFIPFLSWAQLNGRYTFGHGFDATGFIFSPGDQFYTWYMDCTNSSTGKGNYTLKHHTLSLYFTGNDSNNMGVAHIDTFPPKSRDSCVINIFVTMGKDTQGIIGAPCLFENNDKAKVLGITTDQDGRASISIPRFSDPKSLTIRYVGLNPQNILIDPRNDYNILAQMTEKVTQVKKGTILTYKIHMTQDGIRLKSKNNSHSEKYKKTEFLRKTEFQR